jgi:lysophospholipase L1-like esterase
MNVMKENKTILCFGDSNTWGYCPVDSRYPASVRWTGQLAQRLGDGWQVIPEGVCGRCAGSYGDLPAELCGLPALQNALRQHGRPDWLAVLLGTNDLMTGHARSLSARAAMEICRRNCADCRRCRTRFGSTAARTGWLSCAPMT